MTSPRAIRLKESQTGGHQGERVIDARYTIISPGNGRGRGGWRAKLMAALVTIACVALAGLALPPLMVGIYILNNALTR